MRELLAQGADPDIRAHGDARSDAVLASAVFPPGEISFEATGFEQHLTGPEILTDHQCLTRSERGDTLKD